MSKKLKLKNEHFQKTKNSKKKLKKKKKNHKKGESDKIEISLVCSGRLGRIFDEKKTLKKISKKNKPKKND